MEILIEVDVLFCKIHCHARLGWLSALPYLMKLVEDAVKDQGLTGFVKIIDSLIVSRYHLLLLLLL